MTDRRRLVQVTTTDMSLQLLLGGQLTAFAEAGYEVIGVSAAGPYVAELEDHGIIHCPLPSATRSFDPIADLRTLWDLTHLLRQLRPDIVHTHNPKPGIYGRLAAHRAGVPVVVNTVHGLYAVPEDAWARRLPVYAAERFAARYSDCELVQNIEDLEALARIGTPSSKLHLLGNGIDLDRFNDRSVMTRRLAMRARLGIAEDEIVCGVVGRLVWEKGYREIFAAARNLRAVAPSLRILVIGPDEPDKPDAVPEISKREAEACGVSFLGERRDVEDLYSSFDLYVLASHREGVPRSAMEAAATGLPIVATNIRGCRQVVEDGGTGRLVPLGDISALTQAILELSRDADLRARLGRAGIEKARREFDERRVIAITLAAYACLLDQARPAGRRPGRQVLSRR